MQTIDIILLVIIGFGTYRGFSSGLLMQLLGFIAFFLAIIGGFQLMYAGADFMADYISGYSKILPFVSFLAIFFAILFLINLAGKALKSLLDMTLIGSFDNLAGALVGLMKWAFILSVLIWIAGSFELFSIEDYYEGTTLFPLVASIAPLVLDSVSQLIPLFHDTIIPGENLPQV